MAAAAVAGKAQRVLLLLVAGALVCGARADDIERITDFRQDVTVQRDGTLNVAEYITVNAQDDSIVHGIFRDFPTLYRGNVHVRFDVESVTEDGRAVPVVLRSLINGKRLQIGDPDAELSRGLHRFTIRYVTDRQLLFQPDHDELYWNVTGTGWEFQIDRASTTVRLPAGAKIGAWRFFTGEQGERGQAATARLLGDDRISFQTTEPLGPNQGLTIGVDFAKGVVMPPSSWDRWHNLLRDNRGAAGAFAGLVLLMFYFAAVWWLVGRDPRRGTVIPLFAPPRDLSPAAMRYIHRMAYDRKAFAATLIGLAVKGVLTICETKHFLGPVYTLKHAGAPNAPLSRAEAVVADALVAWDGEVELTNKNHAQIAGAISQLKKVLSDEYERIYFNANRAWFWPGLTLIAGSMLAAAILSDDLGGAFLVFLWSGLFGIAAGVFTYFAFNAWRSAVIGHGAHIVNIAIALGRTLAALPFAATLVGVTFFLNDAIQPVTVAILAVEALIALVFYRLLRAPTLAGGKLRDEIDGFDLFLKTAEQARLETLQSPEVTPQLFEKYLPYAVALDCENLWSKRFENAAASAADGAASQSSRRFYVPMWYQGDAFSQLGAAGFASAISVSLGSAVASASTAPGTGGGSSGGFTGGGGGGGGGGGW